MISLYAKQKKRHRCIEQTFGLCGRRRGWDVSREQHRNMYIIYGETDHQPKLDAWDKCSDLVHWEDPEGSGGEGGGRGDQDGNTCKSMPDSFQCMTKPTTMLWGDWPPTNKKKKKKETISMCWVPTTCTSVHTRLFNHGRSPARKAIAPRTQRWNSDLLLSDPKVHSLPIPQAASPVEFSLGTEIEEGGRTEAQTEIKVGTIYIYIHIIYMYI